MPTALIVHGMYGHPGENWFPWLKTELEGKGWRVHIPQFPTKDDLNPEDWWSALAPYEGKIDENTTVIGHSLGVAFLLKVIEKHPVHSAFFIAPAWGITGNEFDPIIGPIANQHFDWELIRKNCPTFTIFHSNNDPYIPLRQAEKLAGHLGAEVEVIEGAGHFNETAGYTEIPLLFEHITKTK
ncbi:hypothetical protein COU76_00120 [Candidatus Peregrinibacteria bacterium CG10_big_fil_rev_8_21_14_0_10_49_10]|nr:MAG: hypothetical protein COU76_00120 [Candidatus Peregrinibacteria bacterium CG10_big_fil_rev_8_21_14_0_10_49_10]